MHAELFEAEPKHHGHRLRSVAAPAQTGIEHIADFPASVLLAVPEEDDVTGHLTGLADLRPQRQRLPFAGELGASPLPGEALGDALPGHRLERDIPADVLAAPVSEQCVNVTRGQRAQ